MSASQITPFIHPLRILPDPSVPPEARNPGALTRLERIALAQERTAEALTRIADRFDRIGDRIDRDAQQMEELITNGGTLAVEAAADAVKRDVLRLSQALDIRRQSKQEATRERSQRRSRSWTEAT